MKIIINSSSMVPIYEQIMEQIKAQIVSGKLKENDVLPSVRPWRRSRRSAPSRSRKRTIILSRRDLQSPSTAKEPMSPLRIRSG